MDHATAIEIVRLRRKEQWAEDYLKRAIEHGDTRRAMRAANYLTVVSSRGDGFALSEVSNFQP